MPEPPSATEELERRRHLLGPALADVEAAVEAASPFIANWDGPSLLVARSELGDVFQGLEPEATRIGTAVALEGAIEEYERESDGRSIEAFDGRWWEEETDTELEVSGFGEEIEFADDGQLADFIRLGGPDYELLPAAEERRQRLARLHASLTERIDDLDPRIDVRAHVGDVDRAQTLRGQRMRFEWRLREVRRDLNEVESQLEGVDQEGMDNACLALAASEKLAERQRGLPGAEQRLPEAQTGEMGIG